MTGIEDKIHVRKNDKIANCRGCNKQLMIGHGTILESPWYRCNYTGLILCYICKKKLMEDLNENNI